VDQNRFGILTMCHMDKTPHGTRGTSHGHFSL
jgi:hypothetical protein